MSWSHVAWDTARAAGLIAYLLLTLAVSVGLVLRNRLQSDRWPRFVVNELHGYLSLLAIVFVALHVVAVLVDPFTRFGIAEIVVPFASHYRPVWMALGIVALYLLLAVWVSSKLRARIGHRTWRSIHVLAYGVYAAATIHGLGTGSDTRAVWALVLYLSSALLVGALAGRRLLVPAARGDRPRPWLVAGGASAVVVVVVWAALGPLAAHWGARAGGTVGSRARTDDRAGTEAATARVPIGVVSTPFRARFAGTMSVRPVDEAGRVTIRIDGALSGGTTDHLEIDLRGVPLENGGVSMEQSRVRLGAAIPVYQGAVVGLDGGQLVASVRSARQRLRLRILLDLTGGGRVSGVVRGTSKS